MWPFTRASRNPYYPYRIRETIYEGGRVAYVVQRWGLDYHGEVHQWNYDNSFDEMCTACAYVKKCHNSYLKFKKMRTLVSEKTVSCD